MEEKDTAQEPAETGQEADTKAKGSKRCRGIIAGIAAVVVVALCGGGYAAWRAHENRLDEQARTDCASAAKTLKASRTAWEKLLNDTKTGAGRIQASQVKDTKTVDALKNAMDVKTSAGSASCTAGNRKDKQSADAAIRKAAKAYDANVKSLKKAAKAVEVSKLGKTVTDATKLLNDTKGRVKDDATRQDLDKAIKARDADAIAKAVKAVKDSKAAKDRADAEAKAQKEAEAAAAAAKAAQPQAAASVNSGYSGSYSSGYSNPNRSYSNLTPSANGSTSSTPSTSTSSQSTGTSNSGGSSYDITKDPFFNQHTTNESCASGKFCPIG